MNANQAFDSQAYLREETAKSFGYKDAEEMISDYRFMREQAEKYKMLELSSNFFASVPDFPNTTQAVEALEQVCRANNWDMENIDNLNNAHAVAVRHGLYQPLTQEQIRASYAGPEPARRPIPPPMIKSGNSDMARPGEDPYTMPLGQNLESERLRRRRAAASRESESIQNRAEDFEDACRLGWAGVDSMVGRAHCSAEDRALIRGFARDLGLLPPDNVFRPIQTLGRAVPQIEATSTLASDPTECEQKRREMVSRSK